MLDLAVHARFLNYLFPVGLCMQIEFEPEYHVNFNNPDIEEKPPMSLEDMLQKVKPFIVAYEGIQNQEEWEVISLMDLVLYYFSPQKCLCK